HGSRLRSHSAAYSVSGSAGCMTRSLAPVHSPSPSSTCVQVSPPSSVRKIPRLPPVEYSLPAAATKTRLPSRGSTITRAMRSVSARPLDPKVLPPSRLTNIPWPPELDRAAFGSPLPIHNVSGEEGSTAISPTMVLGNRSVNGSKLPPLFVVFHTPPDA